MVDDLSERVQQIAADVFGVDPAALTSSSTPDDIDTWDSVAQLNLLVALEDEFGITMDLEAVAMGASIGDIAEFVGHASAD
jgi:acyl carrier protein